MTLERRWATVFHSHATRVDGCRFHLIAMDEVQFFPTDSNFFLAVDELLDRGYDVIAAGVGLDFKREPFGSTLLLFGLCKSGHDWMWLNTPCARCGKPAALPQRTISGKPAPYNAPQVQVGGKETYEPRCYDCHELPGRPVPVCRAGEPAGDNSVIARSLKITQGRTSVGGPKGSENSTDRSVGQGDGDIVLNVAAQSVQYQTETPASGFTSGPAVVAPA